MDGTPYAFDIPAAARGLHDWSAIMPVLRTWHWQRKKLASVINVLAQALYSLFGTPNDNLTVLRLGCFRYFECGGDCVRCPISLLGGLAPDPWLLVFHFFSVAVYSIQLLLQGRLEAGRDRKAVAPPWSAYPGLVWRAVVVLYYACIVIFPVLITELQLNLAGSRNPLLWKLTALAALLAAAGALYVHS